MQSIEHLKIMKKLKYSRMRKFQVEFPELKDCELGSMIICPECNYISKNGKGTAKIYKYGRGKSLKCFCCGIWRKL